MRQLLFVALVTAFAVACGGPENEAFESASDDALTTTRAPVINGQPGSTDIPDRTCDVVLRSVTWSKDSSGHPDLACRGRTCRYVWTGTMDVSESLLSQGVSPFVMFHLTSNKSWYEVPATALGSAPGGFRRFAFRLDDGTPTKASSGKPATMQVTAFVKRPDGKRAFDRNRAVRDTDVDTLSSTNGWSLVTSPNLCPGRVMPKSTLTFASGWQQEQHGAIVQGGRLAVDYDLARMPQCFGSTYNGLSAWTSTASLRFLPGGQLFEGPVKGWNGPNATDFFATTYEVTVPADATAVELWFTTAGAHCATTYDSNFGRNYRFDVLPAAAAPSAPTWAGNWGSVTDRSCASHPGIAEPIVIDEYALERACVFVEAEVYVPGLTDVGEHPERLAAQVEYRTAGDATPKTAWLQYVGRTGNNYRYRWTPDREMLRNLSGDLTYQLRFSTNGNDWFRIGQGDGPLGGAARTIHRQR